MNKLIAIVVMALLVTVLSLAFAYPLMLGINYVFSPHALFTVFGVSRIDFWRTFVLMVVCGMLFKSTGTKAEE